MRRRVFIGLLGGAVAWPNVAQPQPTVDIRRVGVLMSVADDQEGRSRFAAFRNKLEDLGWLEGHNLRIEVCWCDADAIRAAACVAKIAGSAPDVILSSGPEPFVALTTVHHELIVSQANRHKLPAVYPYRFFAAAGGLLSYGSSVAETNRQVAIQVHRILRGARVSDLPAQLASKFELVINLKTAKEVGLIIRSSLLARADEVIE
jgi:hypothetical protein